MALLRDTPLSGGQIILNAYNRIEDVAFRADQVLYHVAAYLSEADAAFPFSVRMKIWEEWHSVARPDATLDALAAQAEPMLLASNLSDEQRLMPDGSPRTWSVPAWTGGMAAISFMAETGGAAIAFDLFPERADAQTAQSVGALRSALLAYLYADLKAKPLWAAATDA